jgi:SAM-dependent methyltransferase
MAGHREQAMAVKRAVIAAIVGQFAHPQGTAGSVAGWVMAHRPSNRQRNRWVVSLLDVQPTDRLLEIGFGPGLAIAELSRRVGDQGHVDGIDHSDVMLRQATRRNAAIAAGRVSLSKASVDQLPPSLKGPFDAILTVNSLGFWPAPTRRLDQLRRRLRPGGRIAIASQPRCPGATASTSLDAARKIEALLQAAGYTKTRTETLDLDPPVVCILAVNPDPLATAARQRQTPQLEAGAAKGIPHMRDRTSVPQHYARALPRSNTLGFTTLIGVPAAYATI